MLITFEGVDGSGKTTVIRELMSRNPHWQSVRFPGQTSVGKLVRQTLLDPDTDMSVVASCLFFMADMRHTMDNMEMDVVYLADRGPDSTYVYQIETSGMGKTLEYAAMDAALKNLIPTPPLTIILDADYKTARERMSTLEFGTPDRYEMVDEALWNRRRAVYENLPYKYKHRLFLTIPTHMYSFGEVVKQCERKIKILVGEDTRDDA